MRFSSPTCPRPQVQSVWALGTQSPTQLDTCLCEEAVSVALHSQQSSKMPSLFPKAQDVQPEVCRELLLPLMAGLCTKLCGRRRVDIAATRKAQYIMLTASCFNFSSCFVPTQTLPLAPYAP